MKKYEVTAHINIIVNVEADNDSKAISEAEQKLEGLNGILKADSYDVKCIED